jgi:hypothetical protein
MPCEFRGNMVICSRGQKRPPKCSWCANVSTKLCDYPVSRGRTCDAPMCDAHAKKQGANLDTCPDPPQMRFF